MDGEQLDEFVMGYLKKRGFSSTAKSLEEDLHHKGSESGNHNNGSSFSSIDYRNDPDLTKFTNLIRSFSQPEDDPTRYHECYNKLRSWAYNSLDLYKHELLRVMYPVFIHCYMDLVGKGHTQEARAFFNSFRKDHEMIHLRDLQKLEGVLTPSHLEEMEFAHSLRQSKVNIKMIDLDSSELPPFSSQCSDESSVKERRKWSPKEDVILIGAWLNTRKEQKAGAFWRRVVEYYNSSPQLAGTPPRKLGQCKQRWSKLNDQVCKFVGCYESASREQSSGQNDNDLMKAAHEIFYNDYNIKFTLDHAWRELRHDQNWCSTLLGKDGGKDKRKNMEDVSGQEEVTEDRPPGVKAAKQKKSRNEDAMTQLQGMLELKEKISKQKLLDRLFAKSEPFSELEKSLQMKLIAEML